MILLSALIHKNALLVALLSAGVCLAGCGEGKTVMKPEDYPPHAHICVETDCAKDHLCDVCGLLLTPAGAHTVEADATCTADAVCTVCGAVVKKATGHVPDRTGDCTHDSVCTVCGEVLSRHTGHNYAAVGDGSYRCANCGDVLSPVVADDGKTVLPETLPFGHFNNTLKAYYAGNVLVCGDYGLEYFRLKESGNADYAAIVNGFAEKYPSLNVTSLLVPKACAFYSPSGYTDCEENQAAFIRATYAMMNDSVKKADAMGELSAHKGEYTYYRTDHHWTSLGAYYASRAYCAANGIEPRELSDYETVVKNGYVGSLYTYAGKVSALRENPDYSVAHLPKTAATLKYRYGSAMIEGKLLNTATNGYAGMFICGDQPFTDIVTEAGTGRKLIVFKESYGNAFVPYMVDYYDEILVMDIRKDSASVASLIRDYGITDALIINNVQGAGSLQGYLKSKLMS